MNALEHLIKEGLSKEEAKLAARLYLAGIPVIPVGPDDKPRQSWRDVFAPEDCRLSLFKRGDGLLALGGHGIDVVDLDSKVEGNSMGNLPPFKSYGVGCTPSGGAHYLIPSTGLGKMSLPGVGDYCGGKPDGSSRLGWFLPGSRRTKYPDGGYVVKQTWDIPGCLKGKPDPDLIEYLNAVAAAVAGGGEIEWNGEPANEVQKAEAAAVLGRMAASLAAMLPGTGREPKLYRSLSRLYRFVAGGSLTQDQVDEAMVEAVNAQPVEAAYDGTYERVSRNAAAWAKKAGPAHPGMGEIDVLPGMAEGRKSHGMVDVTTSYGAAEWLKYEIGVGGLAGVLNRGGAMIYTPRIGEDGYLEPKASADEDGPSQVRVIPPLELCARIDHNYAVIKMRFDKNSNVLMGKDGEPKTKPSVFPETIAKRVMTATDQMSRVRTVKQVSHTPTVREDGSVLWLPGYDDQTGVLYLPGAGLVVPAVSDNPSAEERVQARELVLSMVFDFPWVTPHDRANYLALLITPLLRMVVPPPYKMGLIGAPQAGSGKSLLAWIVRELHGGVFRSSLPPDEAEMGKAITSILHVTTAPVVQFDNCRGTIKSAKLDGLLTSDVWSERPLGITGNVTLANDRLWLATGNNLAIGGDLRRRTLSVTINAGQERPEMRSDFVIEDLKGWVKNRRGELLWALLTMVRVWDLEGRPVGAAPTSDDYGHWIQVCGGILASAGVEGEVGHRGAEAKVSDHDADEWGAFLGEVRRVWGNKAWTIAALLEPFAHADDEQGGFDTEFLPGDVLDKKNPGTALGKYLTYRTEQFAGGYAVKNVGKDRKNKSLWRVLTADEFVVLA